MLPLVTRLSSLVAALHRPVWLSGLDGVQPTHNCDAILSKRTNIRTVSPFSIDHTLQIYDTSCSVLALRHRLAWWWETPLKILCFSAGRTLTEMSPLCRTIRMQYPLLGP